MVLHILMLTVGTVLMFVLFFGIGFILNMLMKTTWFPIYAYIVVLIGLNIYWGWGAEGSVWSVISSYTHEDYFHAIGGLVGAYLSGVTLRYLRKQGYQMF